MSLGFKRKFGITSKYQGGIVSTKNQAKEKRLRQVMELFKTQTELLPDGEDLPLGKLNDDADLGVYNTPNLKDDFSPDAQLIWSLASALYNVDKTRNHQQLYNWFRELLEPGLEYQLERQLTIHNEDPYITVFVYLTFGQLSKASEAATSLGDLRLAFLILHTYKGELKTLSIQSMVAQITVAEWNKMTLFHRKCWYITYGKLGYIKEEGFKVIEGVSWQGVLAMYFWYGDKLEAYNNDIKNNGTQIITTQPDKECLWYQLLQWWHGNESIANFDEWPIDLPWLLKIYKQHSNIDDVYADRFIDELDTNDLADSAIYASLFLERTRKKTLHIIRQCEWDNEKRLIEEYHIPKKTIQMSKALNAHDSWDFELEYEHLLEGNLLPQARLSLLYFLLPKLLKDDKAELDKSISSIDKYLAKEHDAELAILRDAYQYLANPEERDMDTTAFILNWLKENHTMKTCQSLFNSLINLIDSHE